MTRQVFVTGGTGYVGSRLVAELVARGHAVRALVRPGSERKLPPGAEVVTGDALDHATFAAAVRPGDTFVQLVGTPHPSPRKAAQFRAVDLVSARAQARRLALVTLDDMVAALVQAVESPPEAVCVVEVPEIRGARRRLGSADA